MKQRKILIGRKYVKIYHSLESSGGVVLFFFFLNANASHI